jgi:hypothetical protein
MFCAAIPAVAATGAALNNKQRQRLHLERESVEPEPLTRPILKITGAAIVLLLAASITYHTLRFGY